MTAITTTPGGSVLRAVMRLDATVTGANGVAYLALAGPLEDLLGLSPALLRGVGAFLVAFAVFVALAGTRVPLAVIVANVAWAAHRRGDRGLGIAGDGRHGVDRAAGDHRRRVRRARAAGSAARTRRLTRSAPLPVRGDGRACFRPPDSG
jgi:hypothetical protein